MDYQITSEDIPGIVIGIVITAAYYMGPLLVYRFFIYRRRLPKSTAKKACILSGIIMFMIMFVIYAVTDFDGSLDMKPAVLYSWIAYFIIREKEAAPEVRGELEDQIRKDIDFYRKMYNAKNPDMDDELAAAANELFVQMIPYLKLVPFDELKKEMKKSKKTAEEVSLNVMHNFVMMIAQENISTEDALFGINNEAEAAISVYRFVNDVKLDKKYISQEQYDENERLITAIRYNAPYF